MRKPLPATISIDPARARDLDDALGVSRLNDGGWRLDVLIPDVPTLVARGSEVDIEARRLGLTTYAATGIRVPMLPISMVDALSLSPKEDRPVIHVEIAIDATLRSAVTEITATSGRTVAALSYDQADAALDDAAHPHHAAVADLWDLARRLAEDRAAAIGADFDDSGSTWISEEGSVILAGKQRAHRSNILVMEIMILVNTALARHARDQGVPVLYRNHLLEGFARGDRASATHELAMRHSIGRHTAAKRIRGMTHLAQQATIGTEPAGHYGLDADCYAWFTSPLRRYADLASLRALVHGQVDDDLEALASRLTGIHRSQIESGDEHHGKAARRRLLPLLRRGQHDELGETDVHVIIRALVENPDFDDKTALLHLSRRMAEDRLSGRDIAALQDNVAQLFGEQATAAANEWIGDGPRAMLLAEYRAGAVQPTANAPSGVNHKGMVHELAQVRRARVTFGPASRTGAAHAPVFTVTATWQQGGRTVEATGIERTIRNAEQAAALNLLEKVQGDQLEGDAQTPGHGIATATSPTPPGVAPKTHLLEIATATGATVTFGEARGSGPPHAPRFSVEVRHRIAGNETAAYGEGGSKREAERNASEEMLRRLAATK